MATHMLDWGVTKCSCKWGGCKICWASNRLISLHNDLMKFGLPKEVLKEKLTEANRYLDKIDSFTLYEYLSWQIDEETFDEALKGFISTKRNYVKKRESEVVDTTWRVNPERMCHFLGNSPWDRCVYCNSIRKYMKWKECPKFKETLGTTDTKNK